VGYPVATVFWGWLEDWNGPLFTNYVHYQTGHLFPHSFDTDWGYQKSFALVERLHEMGVTLQPWSCGRYYKDQDTSTPMRLVFWFTDLKDAAIVKLVWHSLPDYD